MPVYISDFTSGRTIAAELCPNQWRLQPLLIALEEWAATLRKRRCVLVAEVRFRSGGRAASGGSVISTDFLANLAAQKVTVVLSEEPTSQIGAAKKINIDSRLDGTWRSNRHATAAAWRSAGLLPEKVIKRFEKNVLGRLTVHYDRRRVLSVMGAEWVESVEYRLVRRCKQHIVISQYSKVWGMCLNLRIRFDKDAYWVSARGLWPHEERFDRVTQ